MNLTTKMVTLGVSTAAGLSFVIGNKTKFNPLTGSVDSLSFDRQTYALDQDGNAYIRVGYSSFLARRDAAFYAQVIISDDRYANTKIFTLKGGNIQDNGPFNCTGNCTIPVTLTFSESNEPVSYAHITPNCTTTNIQDYNFSTDADGLVRTDLNGNLTIHATSTMSIDPDTNQTVQDTGTITCTYTIDREFQFNQ